MTLEQAEVRADEMLTELADMGVDVAVPVRPLTGFMLLGSEDSMMLDLARVPYLTRSKGAAILGV